MKFYRVKADYDNKVRYFWGNGRNTGKTLRNGILVANELYTERERAKIANGNWFFDLVEIPKNKTYWFFGARFEAK